MNYRHFFQFRGYLTLVRASRDHSLRRNVPHTHTYIYVYNIAVTCRSIQRQPQAPLYPEESRKTSSFSPTAAIVLVTLFNRVCVSRTCPVLVAVLIYWPALLPLTIEYEQHLYELPRYSWITKPPTHFLTPRIRFMLFKTSRSLPIL